MNVILDASALLAWLQQEPGSKQVEEHLHKAGISALNLSEVLQKSLARGVDTTGLTNDLVALGITVLPFAASDAEEAAQVWVAGQHLSLADHACLALGIRHQLPVLTTDRAWSQTQTGATVHLIR